MLDVPKGFAFCLLVSVLPLSIAYALFSCIQQQFIRFWIFENPVETRVTHDSASLDEENSFPQNNLTMIFFKEKKIEERNFPIHVLDRKANSWCEEYR